jgi:hypothetical protein
MHKEIIFTAIKYALGAMIITLSIASLWPWYLRSLETRDAARSLPSIKTAGEAIKLYEAEWGKLPPVKSWVQGASSYKEISPDPTYVNLTGIEQPQNPGWGMNGRMELTRGNTSDQPKTIKSSEFPEDAVLLAPSYYQAFYPQRNGVLPKQPLSKDDETQTQHGLRLGSRRGFNGVSGLYMLNNGSIKQLSLDQAEAILKLRPMPPSERVKTIIEVAEGDTLGWGIKEGVQKFPNHIALKRGDVTTPLIPVRDQNFTITFEATSPNNAPFVLEVVYYNEYKMPLNVDIKDGKLVFVTQLSAIYGGGQEIFTTKPVTDKKNTYVAFNPSFGSAFPIVRVTRASELDKETQTYKTRLEKKVSPHFVKGTPITLFKDLTKKWTERAPNDWKAFERAINIKDLPEGTAFIGLKVENQTYSPILIRDVRVKRPKSP